MGSLLVIGIIILVIGFYISKTNKGPGYNPKTGLTGRMGSILGIVLIIASIIAGSFTTIPAGYRGVVIRFSAVTGTILQEGLQTKLPFLDSVVMMDVRTDKYEVAAAAASRDLQDVS